jgi:putative flippase GtrA
VVGIVATALHYGIYYLLQRFINVNVAYTAGYALSFVANFYLTAYFTFSRRPSWRKAFGFGGAHLVNYLLHLFLLNLFLFLGLSKPIAPLPVFAIAIPVNFLLVRYVFTKWQR